MSTVYAILRLINDLKSVDRAISTRSGDPIARRIGRRIYGKVTGRLAARLFG